MLLNMMSSVGEVAVPALSIPSKGPGNGGKSVDGVPCLFHWNVCKVCSNTQIHFKVALR